MNRVRGLAAVVAIAALAVPTLAVPAGAALVQKSGWWWRLQTGGLISLDPPPNVPDGGLSVSHLPDGPSAVAAVRFALNDGEVPGELRLTLATDGNAAAAATIVACPSATSWVPANAGAWADRPTPDCDAGSTPGSVSADGTALVFDVSAFAITEASLDVMIVPAPDSTIFDVAFVRPDSDSLLTTTVTNPSGNTPPPGPAPTPQAETVEPSPVGLGAPRPVTFGQTPTPASPDPSPSVGPPAVADETSTPPPVAAPTALAADGLASTPDPDHRGLGILVLVVAAAALVWAARAPLPALAGLGRPGGPSAATPLPAAPEPGGIGRFRRVRHGPPPRLF